MNACRYNISSNVFLISVVRLSMYSIAIQYVILADGHLFLRKKPFTAKNCFELDSNSVFLFTLLARSISLFHLASKILRSPSFCLSTHKHLLILYIGFALPPGTLDRIGDYFLCNNIVKCLHYQTNFSRSCYQDTKIIWWD